MVSIQIDKSVKEACPSIRLGCLFGKIKVEKECSDLWSKIDPEIEGLATQLSTEAIAKIERIQAARRAYKSFGKDPARYRLSAEALLRRIVKGKGIYQINNIVDLLNLVSVKSGFSIGGYDVSGIEGDVVLGIGAANEPYAGIGRGDLNIEFLPVLRDAVSAFGSPTSDSLRTMAQASTTEFLMVFFDFGTSDILEQTMREAQQLMQDFAHGSDFQQWLVSP